jgi:hypothetical protein
VTGVAVALAAVPAVAAAAGTGTAATGAAEAALAGGSAFGLASMSVMPGQVPELICERASFNERAGSAGAIPALASKDAAASRVRRGFMVAAGGGRVAAAGALSPPGDGVGR